MLARPGRHVARHPRPVSAVPYPKSRTFGCPKANRLKGNSVSILEGGMGGYTLLPPEPSAAQGNLEAPEEPPQAGRELRKAGCLESAPM